LACAFRQQLLLKLPTPVAVGLRVLEQKLVVRLDCELGERRTLDALKYPSDAL
jgi:hypothetical protein